MLSRRRAVWGQSMIVPPKLRTPAEKTRCAVRRFRSRSSRPSGRGRRGRGCAPGPGFRAARAASSRRSRCRSGRTASRCEAGAGEQPTERASAPTTVKGCCRSPLSLARYWAPRSAASGLPASRHSPIRRAVCTVAVDAPEEVVRGQEDEPAAEVAVALDEVVEAPRDVLGVAREDDQVVRGAQRLAATGSGRCPRRRRCRRHGRARRASGGTGPRSCGSARARRGGGAGGRGRSASVTRASTRCRRTRRRCGRSSCRPARSSSAARSRPAGSGPRAGRRAARTRGGRTALRAVRRRGRSPRRRA